MFWPTKTATASKQMHASLASVTFGVTDSTVTKCLDGNGIHAKF